VSTTLSADGSHRVVEFYASSACDGPRQLVTVLLIGRAAMCGSYRGGSEFLTAAVPMGVTDPSLLQLPLPPIANVVVSRTEGSPKLLMRC
jgi:hypothetical protein